MPRYIATVEYDAGTYRIRFPGIEKMGCRTKDAADIVACARRFLDRHPPDLVRLTGQNGRR
jgi:hypothetical protein